MRASASSPAGRRCAVGYRVEDVRAELSTRRWVRLRKGVYVAADDVPATDRRQRHLVDCVAVLLSLDPARC